MVVVVVEVVGDLLKVVGQLHHGAVELLRPRVVCAGALGLAQGGDGRRCGGGGRGAGKGPSSVVLLRLDPQEYRTSLHLSI